MEVSRKDSWSELQDFYRGKRVLVTGHTGFKGSWLVRILMNMGADVTGYALKGPTDPCLFDVAGLEDHMDSVEGDVRDLAHLKEVFERVRPEVVLHLAAQPIVRDSYKDPVYTYETNVMGTVNVLECVRLTPSVRSFLNVTTDKVYENKEWEYGYRENDPLDGYDPYSNSKSCSELVTHSYQKSFSRTADVPFPLPVPVMLSVVVISPTTGSFWTASVRRLADGPSWCGIHFPPDRISMY